MQRMALVVGINDHRPETPLSGCVNDAQEVAAALEYHGNGEKNFSVQTLTTDSEAKGVPRSDLHDHLVELFDAPDLDTALFYFAGHGAVRETGGYLWTSECRRGDEGVPLTAIVDLANRSRANNRIIILDSCRSGLAGLSTTARGYSEISEGVAILTASTAEHRARESKGSGVFTALLVDGLLGGAANLVGDVTVGGLYAHIDQALGPWEQRPVFKCNVHRFLTLRKVSPVVPIESLRLIVDFFPTPDADFQLDPSFEPESREPNPKNTADFAILQRYNRANLVVPVGVQHMYHAAIHRMPCRLTPLGKHYWRLASKRLL